MNRTDRLLAIVLELQAKGIRRAEDLAQRFTVTKRTIYRDIQALCEAGVPIAAEAGVGYWIVEGYFLPPVNLTGDEAMMLLLGADFVGENFDKQYRDAVRMAVSKIEAVLSPKLRKDVRSLKKRIRFYSMNPQGKNAILSERLKKLRRAILDSKTVRFRYHKRHGDGTPTNRLVDPYTLTHIGGNWLLGGYDHLRKDLRMFRLSRMEHVDPTDKAFQLPPAFRMRDFGKSYQPAIEVELLFQPSVSRWVLESSPYYLVRHRRTAKGLLAILKVSRFDEMLSWLLSWGSSVRVISPPELQEIHAGHAQRLTQAYNTPR